MTGANVAGERWDAIVVGGGHNGLVCGAYLARAGLKVQVLERNDYPSGGNAVCEDDQGYRFDLWKPAPGY